MSQQMSDTAEMPPVETSGYGYGLPQTASQLAHSPSPEAGWPVMTLPQPEPSRTSRLMARRRDRGPVTWPMVVQTAIRWAGGIGIVALLAWAGQK